MEKIIVTVKGVRVFVNEFSSSVQLTLAEPIKGFKQDDDGNFVEEDVKQISLPRSKFTAQLCEASDDIAMYRATLDHALGQKEFGVILFNAKLQLQRERKAAGEVYTINGEEQVAERDCYLTDVTGVQLSDRAIRAIDNAIAL